MVCWHLLISLLCQRCCGKINLTTFFPINEHINSSKLYIPLKSLKSILKKY